MTDALPPPREMCSGRFLRLIAQGHWEYAERTTATGAVAIVAITDDRRIVLVEQFRIPLGYRGDRTARRLDGRRGRKTKSPASMCWLIPLTASCWKRPATKPPKCGTC